MDSKNHNIKVAVAMSGGVDSSVTAALLVQKYGRENVFGITMELFCVEEDICGGSNAVSDAKKVCEQLGIHHFTLDLKNQFEKTVIANFINEYHLGHTPIPCVLCNKVIKFGSLLDKAKELAADFLATGHYARIEEKSGQYLLKKGLDATKDQSYFLYGLTQEQLSKILFPLGNLKKTAVRKLAKKYQLKTAEKKESQGICFVTEGRVTDWLRDKIKMKPGKIVDSKGKVIGEHEGIIFYTVGQRKRIGGGYAEPMYVVKIDAKKNEVAIGTKDELYGKSFDIVGPHWINPVKMPLKCTAKIRYNMNDEPCLVENVESDKYRITFKKPQRAITPGQSVVFYKNDEVLGGGIIQTYA